MTKKILHSLVLIIFILSKTLFLSGIIEKPIVIIVPSYNNEHWYEKNLKSIFSQNYTNYRVIYINDCSSDDTGPLVEAYIKKMNQSHRVTLIHHATRHRQLANHYMAVHMCENYEIVVNLDGDDWLAHSNVFRKLNSIYADPNVWITWGQFRHWPKTHKGICRPVSQSYNFRKQQWVTSHLRTFYAGLFKQIKKEDLLDETGNFYYAAADFAIMMPMLEMAGHEHRRFIPEVLYIYNRANAINVNKVNKKRVQGCSKGIRSRQPYKPLSFTPTQKDL